MALNQCRCGGEPRAKSVRSSFYRKTVFFIQCQRCGINTHHRASRQQAEKEWRELCKTAKPQSRPRG